MYLGLDPLQQDPIRLFAFTGSSGQAYSWNIKITMVDCSAGSDIQAPPGCLQYHTKSGNNTSLIVRQLY